MRASGIKKAEIWSAANQSQSKSQRKPDKKYIWIGRPFFIFAKRRPCLLIIRRQYLNLSASVSSPPLPIVPHHLATTCYDANPQNPRIFFLTFSNDSQFFWSRKAICGHRDEDDKDSRQIPLREHITHYVEISRKWGLRREPLACDFQWTKTRSLSPICRWLKAKTAEPASPFFNSPGNEGQNEFRDIKRRCGDRWVDSWMEISLAGELAVHWSMT